MRQFFYANDFLFLKNKKQNNKNGRVESIILKFKLNKPTNKKRSTMGVNA